MKLKVRIRKNKEECPPDRENIDKDIIDSDADGICDSEEEILGTDPNDPDSDHDGLGDYEEVYVYKTDPLDRDTDHDGISDAEEVSLGYNPRGPGKLADFFIASHSNSHRPHALHIRRILFYALAALAIKAVVVISLLTLPIDAWLDPNVALEQSRKIIALTNQVRQNLGLNSLRESAVLDQAAAAKAQDMLSNQYFAHVSPDNKNLYYWLKAVSYNFLFAGENLAMGFSDASDVVNAWTQSKTHYANLIDPDYTEIGVSMVSGPYKQYETTFVAQMFGKPKIAVSEPAPPAKTASSEQVTYPPVEVKTEAPKVEPKTETQASAVPPPEVKPVAVSQPAEVKPVKTDSTPALPASEPEESGEISQSELTPLAKPIIVSPEDNFLSNQTELAFKVIAQDADSVSLVAGGGEIASSSIRDGEFFKISANLEPGIHKIAAIGNRGQESSTSEQITVTIDNEPPVIDQTKSSLAVMPGDDEHEVVRVTAFLSADTVSAEANFSNYSIQLMPDASDLNKWTGETLIFKEDDEEIFSPVVLASVTATDHAGSTVTRDIVWGNIRPVKASLLNQYLYLKNNQSPYAQMLFDISSLFYKVLLVLAVLVLSVNIYLQLHKRHPHIIMSTLGLITLLVVLILV